MCFKMSIRSPFIVKKEANLETLEKLNQVHRRLCYDNNHLCTSKKVIFFLDLNHNRLSGIYSRLQRETHLIIKITFPP